MGYSFLIVPSFCHLRFPLLRGFLTRSYLWRMPQGRKTAQAVGRRMRKDMVLKNCKTYWSPISLIMWINIIKCNLICRVIKKGVNGSILPILTFHPEALSSDIISQWFMGFLTLPGITNEFLQSEWAVWGVMIQSPRLLGFSLCLRY